MALAYDSLAPAFENYLDCFSEPPGTFLGLRSHYFANYADPIPAFHDSLAKK
jgi:hypothetical protein